MSQRYTYFIVCNRDFTVKHNLYRFIWRRYDNTHLVSGAILRVQWNIFYGAMGKYGDNSLYLVQEGCTEMQYIWFNWVGTVINTMYLVQFRPHSDTHIVFPAIKTVGLLAHCIGAIETVQWYNLSDALGTSQRHTHCCGSNRDITVIQFCLVQ